MPSPKKNIILFVHKVQDYTVNSILEYNKKSKVKYRIGLITEKGPLLDPVLKQLIKQIDVHIECDTSSDKSIQKSVLPYQNQIIAITSRGDDGIPLLSKLIPHLPYLRTPSTESLLWATDKIWMRRRMFIYNKKITPSYTLVENISTKALQKIEEKVGYPAIVKPTGLGASKLVTIVYHRDELEQTLKRIFRTIKSVYEEAHGRWDPKVLVEQFMEGEMYSFDAQVTSRGKVYFCPPVHIKTGRSIGFDDFFGYSQMTPTLLSKKSIEDAEEVATEAIHALALRSTSIHIELMKMEKGWKVIELGPRVGGFRHELYNLSYGIDLTMNDILVRIPEKIKIPKKVLAHSVAMKFFAKKEGPLTKLIGIKKATELESFYKITVNKKIGDTCRYAKNGGASVFNIILSNPSRPKLLADIRRLEQMISIETHS
jgi:biotin carboxylase